MNIERLRFAFLALFVASCSTTKINYTPKSEQISFPEIGREVSVSVGENMLSQGTKTLTKGIVLNNDNNIRNYTFSKGFYPQIGEDENYTYHSYRMGHSSEGFGFIRITGGLLGPMVNDAVSLRAARHKQELCVDRSVGAKMCDTEKSYERSELPIVSENNFQQSLIYSGRVGNKIKIGYREFGGGMARAAYSNEVEYDLGDGMEITYKGARIKILEANNRQIKYIVESNFNIQQ